MIGEYCELCGAIHSDENYVVFEYEMLICIDCLLAIDDVIQENANEQGG